jgi:hypothetical protein
MAVRDAGYWILLRFSPARPRRGIYFSATQGARVLIGKMGLGTCLRKLGLDKTGLCLWSDRFLLSGRQGMGYPIDDNSQKNNTNPSLKSPSNLNPVDC